MKLSVLIALLLATFAFAQQPPYDVAPEAEPPYYRVRYDASEQEGELDLPVQFTVWVPPDVETLRGVVVHQHGCGEGSCRSGLTGAFDLHWQALAEKHECALLAASYEQPQSADCSRWCDPRNGSEAAFRKGLADLGQASGHPELASVPWALWGHSGGATWSGIMTLLHPDRVAAAWLRSGAPLVTPRPERPTAKTIELPDEALPVPIMLNLGTKEGVTVTDGRFSGVWPRVQEFFKPLRASGSPIGIAIDPLTSHECGNQRYLAIPWLDACLAARLPQSTGQPLRGMPEDDVHYADVDKVGAFPASDYEGDVRSAIWLPNERVAKMWVQYVTTTFVADETPPPAPSGVAESNGVVTWTAAADLESGIRQFLIFRDGKQIGSVPETPRNRFGRPLFQGLQYSDTPEQPLTRMEFVDRAPAPGKTHRYRVVTVNTVGLKSR